MHGHSYSYCPTLFYLTTLLIHTSLDYFYTKYFKSTVVYMWFVCLPIQSRSYMSLECPYNPSPPVYYRSVFGWDGFTPGFSNSLIYQICPVLKMGLSFVLALILWYPLSMWTRIMPHLGVGGGWRVPFFHYLSGTWVNFNDSAISNVISIYLLRTYLMNTLTATVSAILLYSLPHIGILACLWVHYKCL